MLYVNAINGNNFSIMDTEDGVAEVVTKEKAMELAQKLHIYGVCGDRSFALTLNGSFDDALNALRRGDHDIKYIASLLVNVQMGTTAQVTDKASISKIGEFKFRIGKTEGYMPDYAVRALHRLLK